MFEAIAALGLVALFPAHVAGFLLCAVLVAASNRVESTPRPSVAAKKAPAHAMYLWWTLGIVAVVAAALVTGG